MRAANYDRRHAPKGLSRTLREQVDKGETDVPHSGWAGREVPPAALGSSAEGPLLQVHFETEVRLPECPLLAGPPNSPPPAIARIRQQRFHAKCRTDAQDLVSLEAGFLEKGGSREWRGEIRHRASG